ncbi:MAG: energy transducer TonB, partial [Muribaculaceae bacterium]|nr:energy transducer TonB [Muribaculaceae bacterium]
IAIVDADQVKNEVMDMETQKEDNTARGVVNQEGSDDADKFKAVQEQVVVKEPEPEKPKEEEIFQAVEQNAEFPGGQAALMKFLKDNIRYPEAAQQNDIQGRVIVRFVVEKDGSIGQITIMKGVDKDLDREALRVVKKMPKWQPGKNNGVAVRSYFNLPVTFRLQQQ